ncbi:zinc finger protein OZF-like [Anneissia japonica]|uniref:zinc finger protein OZF-like n=1 Tax=Anneissia japonica TaxID=1529436 RepID=UPI00142569F1|nr:zinc finger protein OZF-like [Anneissia japonica]
MIKEDLMNSEEYTSPPLLKCTNCGGNWIDKRKFKKHTKLCFKVTQETKVKRTKKEKTTKLGLAQTPEDVEQEEEVIEYSARGRKIIRPKLYQAGDTAPSKRSQISIEDIPGSSTPTLADKEENEGSLANEEGNEGTLFDEEENEGIEMAEIEDDTDDNHVLFECEKCMQMFVTEEKFTDHDCSAVPRRKLYLECQVCTIVFQTNKSFRAHMKKYHVDQSFTCKYCHTVFMKRTHYDNHMEMHQNKQAGISFECKPCRMLFYTRVQLMNHQNDKHNMQHYPYVCKHCGRAFRKPASLDFHLYEHSSSKPIRCAKCPETFAKLKLFSTHMETHINQELGTKEVCRFCGKQYLNRTSLKNHISFVHKKADKMCEVCGKVFKNADHLKRHRNTHDAVKPYKCLDCGKDFAELTNLRKHSRIHTGLKPYKCDICSLSFNHNVSLKTHKKSTHGIDWWAEDSIIKDLQKQLVENMNKNE